MDGAVMPRRVVVFTWTKGGRSNMNEVGVVMSPKVRYDIPAYST